MNKLILTLLLGIFLISFTSAVTTITLNSPADTSTQYTNLITTNSSVVITGGATVKNITLWDNSTGTWSAKNTTSVSSITEAHGVALPDTSGTLTLPFGEKIYVGSTPVYLLNISKDGGTQTHWHVRTTRLGDNNDLANGTFTGNVATLSTPLKLNASTFYYIMLDSNGAGYTQKQTPGTASYNTSGTYITWTAGGNGNADTDSGVQYFGVTSLGISTMGATHTQTFANTYSAGTIVRWNHLYCDSTNSCSFATANRTFIVDNTAPTISLNYPTSLLNYGAVNNVLTLNFTATDTNLNSCKYNYNGTNVTVSCSSGTPAVSNITLSSKKNVTFYILDNVGNLNTTTFTWDYKIFENSRTYNASSFETAYENYQVDLTANSTLTAVNLIYGGSSYAMTNIGSGIWSYSRDLPSSVLGNNSLNFSYTYGNTIYSDYLTYQYVNYTIFTICNSTYSNDFLNLTFKDETTLSNINASISSATFQYYLGTGTEYKTYTYSNLSENNHYGFCASPTDRTLNVDPYVQFLSTGYPQRIWNPSLTDYTATVTNQVLYLLSTADGIYVTFQVINSADQVLSGVFVTAIRSISGNDIEIASGTTGASGTVTFWLSPDFEHLFSFTKTGLNPYSYADTPTQSSYTITMGGGATVNNNTFQGIDYSIIPINNSLTNNTVYTFGFNLTSSYWDVSEYGFNLRLANGTVITGSSTGTEGTQLTKLFNSTNQSIVYLDYYWVINGTYTNGTKYWVIINSENTGWSIKNFFVDLLAYLDSGIFGLDDFGLNVIVFLVLFISVGMTSYKYGLSSPLGVTTLLFAITFFLDAVLGLIPAIRGTEHLLTYITALALVISIFREVQTR